MYDRKFQRAVDMKPIVVLTFGDGFSRGYIQFRHLKTLILKFKSKLCLFSLKVCDYCSRVIVAIRFHTFFYFVPLSFSMCRLNIFRLSQSLRSVVSSLIITVVSFYLFESRISFLIFAWSGQGCGWLFFQE